jgi:YD repeat-containing protein
MGQYEAEAVFAPGENDMFVVGRQSRRFQGDNVRTSSQWRSISIMNRAYDAWGTSSSNMYAVGIGINASGGRISHYDGNATNTWTTEFERPLDVFRGIWGSGEFDIFVVGDNGTILQYRDLPPPETAGNFPYSGMVSPYVNAHTGELVLSEVDLRRGHAAPVEFERYYASGLRYETRVGGHLGRNWTHTYEWGIDIDVTEVTVISNRGRHFTFELVGTDWQLVAPLDKPYSLTEFGGEFAFADPGAEKIYRFSKALNKLTAIDDRNGNRVALEYTSGVLFSAHDRQGNGILFRYNSSTRLEAVYTDGASSSPQPRYEITFSYINGNLASVTDAGGRVTTYEYAVGREADGLLHAAHLPLSTERRWIYDDQGRVTATLLTDGGDFLYDYGILSTDVTNPDGIQSAIWHDDNGAKTRHADGIGNVDTWSYDQDGRVATYTDRVGRTTSWLYEGGSFKVASVTGADGNAIEYSWEMHGSAGGFDFYDNTRIDYPDGTSVQFGHDNNGNVTSFTDQLANVWTYTHDGAGNVLTATDPGGAVTEYRYQTDGALREITDSAGNLTFLLYDGYRRPTGADFADQSRLLVTWNARGDVEQIATPAGDVIAYLYNEDGRQSRIVTADGGAIDFTYTAGGNLLERTVGNANTTSFTYDDYGRTRGVTNPDGSSYSYVYDAAGRLTAYLDGAGRTWAVDYDADGQPQAARMPNGDRIDFDNAQHALGLISSISAGDERISLQYDVMNRLTGLSDALENVSGIVRDGRGLVTETNLAALQITARFERNALGQVTKLTDPNGGEWRSTYDAHNRLASSIDPLGNETRYGHDNMNRIDRVTYPAGSGSVDVIYGATGEPSRLDASSGEVIEVDTDIEGDVVGGTNLTIGRGPNGNIYDSNGIGIAYDSNDRISRITFSPNRYIDYEYDTRGNLTTVTDWAGGVTSLVPDERGRLASITRPDGIGTSYAYNRAGRVTGITFSGIGAITLQRNELGQSTSATRNLPGLRTLETSEETFTFNAASQVAGNDYDVTGNLRRDRERTYQFDLFGRLVRYDGETGSVSLVYDALGNRVSSQGPTGNRSYVYNYALGDTRVGIEREGGQDLWYYVHTKDGRLLYRIDASGNRQHYYFDEMGNTVFMTDNVGSVIQSYFVGPAGEVLNSSGQVDNDITTAGEFGGWQMRDAANLVSLYGRYINLNSLKPLTRLLQDSDDPLEINPYRVDQPSHQDADLEASARRVVKKSAQKPRPGGRRMGFLGRVRVVAPTLWQLKKFVRLVELDNLPRRPTRKLRPPKGPAKAPLGRGVRTPKDALDVIHILCLAEINERARKAREFREAFDAFIAERCKMNDDEEKDQDPNKTTVESILKEVGVFTVGA